LRLCEKYFYDPFFQTTIPKKPKTSTTKTRTIRSFILRELPWAKRSPGFTSGFGFKTTRFGGFGCELLCGKLVRFGVGSVSSAVRKIAGINIDT